MLQREHLVHQLGVAHDKLRVAEAQLRGHLREVQLRLRDLADRSGHVPDRRGWVHAGEGGASVLGAPVLRSGAGV